MGVLAQRFSLPYSLSQHCRKNTGDAVAAEHEPEEERGGEVERSGADLAKLDHVRFHADGRHRHRQEKIVDPDQILHQPIG